ncbi:unnamed protein product [Rotaria sp. Silwood1]|nr:unnamed protein product [Rotaria sp. Silwood1]
MILGQSKTLSFQIVLQNLQGSQLSKTDFCKKLPAVDPFFCLGSKYTSSNDIACVFERAIKREQQYQQNQMGTRCVVFLDEASLPDEKRMVLKVLHQYLDECKVAFVAIANKAFDAANANRMTCIYRSLPSENDQKILAYGCLGLSDEQSIPEDLSNIIFCLCQGYRRVLESSDIPKIFHDRDFIYMLRELRFELQPSSASEPVVIDTIRPESLLHALENNFNGITSKQFEKLTEIVFHAVQEKRPDFELSLREQRNDVRRDVIRILHDSMKLESVRRRLYGRYKLIIDESDDESAVRLLFQTGIIDPHQTIVFRMSDFSDDINNELRNVEMLSTIKLCMETGKTILMVNTGRIHGSLYDVFNQNFSIMATGDTRKIFSKVAIGSKTVDVVVNDNFQCIVHINRHEFDDIPAPFLSRFQKYSLSIIDIYRIQLKRLSAEEQNLMNNVEKKMQTFIKHFGIQYIYGLNDNTLYSCLLSLIETDENRRCFITNIQQTYTILNIRTKIFIEKNPENKQQCLLRSILSKLIQIASPESIIFKLPTFEDKFAESLFQNYFHHQEHFNIENLVRELLQKPSENFEDNGSSYRITTEEHAEMNIMTTTKTIVENAAVLEEKFRAFEHDSPKRVLIVVINGQIGQQRQHLLFVRQLIDKTEFLCNKKEDNQRQEKYFIMLVHVPPQELYNQSGFPSIFLHGWDFYFFDTCTPGSAFHLQKMLQIVSSPKKQFKEPSKYILCDLNVLFDDCLWDFCTRIQIFLPQLPREMFTDENAYDFYRNQTSTTKRVECLKKILQRLTQLQEQMMNIYHEQLSKKKNSSQSPYNIIYQMSKDILCGKRLIGLVDALQLQIRASLTNFVSNLLKYLANDYGLETLSKLSAKQNNVGSTLNLIDYTSFALDDDNEQTLLGTSSSELIFRLAQVYTTFEYEKNDISLIYSAYRIIDSFHENRSYFDELCQNKNSTRSEAREELFRFLFDLLWNKLNQLCASTDEKDIQQWTYMYTFIYKYYPSDALLCSTKLVDIGNQIEFMRLSYSIFVDETIPDPTQLVTQLLKHQPRDTLRSSISNNKSSYLKILPTIINIIHEYLSNRIDNEHAGSSSLMIDFQQWILSILRTSKPRTQDDINNIFVCLDCKAADELCIRHLLVNLMAMIIKGGAKSFLWTFAFQPLAIENTFGK